MDEWREHKGYRDPPLPGDTRVNVLYEDGTWDTGKIHDWDENWQWTNDMPPHDKNIVMYKVLKNE